MLGPGLNAVFEIRMLRLQLEDDAICPKLAFVGEVHPLPIVIIVVQQREQGVIKLLPLLMGIKVFSLHEIVRIGQLMQRKNVESCYPLVAVDGNLDIVHICDLLDRKVIPDSTRPVPNKLVDGR